MRKNILAFSIALSIVFMIISFMSANTINYLIPSNIGFHSLTKPTQKEVECLTENIFFEAGFEPKNGQIAVALVTLNRLTTGNYGKDVCGVVYQKTKGVCQFSWVCDQNVINRRLTIKDHSLYNEIRQLATSVFLNYDKIPDITEGATFYHADYVNPGWKLPITTKIGAHIFYKSARDVEQMKRNI